MAPNGLGGDFSSFERDPKELAEEIVRKKKAKETGEAPPNGKSRSGFGVDNSYRQRGGDEHIDVEILSGASVRPVSVNWQWNGWLSEGKVHLIAGAKGTMKTTIAIDF